MIGTKVPVSAPVNVFVCVCVRASDLHDAFILLTSTAVVTVQSSP